MRSISKKADRWRNLFLIEQIIAFFEVSFERNIVLFLKNGDKNAPTPMKYSIERPFVETKGLSLFVEI